MNSKFFCFFLLLCCITNSVFSQSQKKARIEYYENQLKSVESLRYTNPDSAYKIAEKAIKTTQQENLISYQGKFLLAQGVVQYQREKNKEAELLYNRALVIFKKNGDLSGEAKVYSNLGLLAREANDIEKSLMLQNKALQIRLSINDPLLTSSYNNIAAIYYTQGKYPKSLALYLQGLPIAEKNNNKLFISTFVSNIGLIYWKQSRYNEAFEYFEKCLIIEKEINNYSNVAATYNNMAGIKITLDSYDEAIKYCKEAIVYAEKVNANKQLARSYNLLGQLEYRKKNYQSSINYELIGLEKRRKLGDHSGMSRSLIALGESYIELKEFAKSEQVLLEALKISSGSSLLKEKESCYKLLANLYNRMGNWEKANAYYVLRDGLKDSLFNESNSKIIFDLQTKYETSKKESQISLLNKENNIKALMLLNSKLALDKNKFLINEQQQQLTINDLELANKNQILANQQLDAKQKAQNIKALEKQTRIQNLEITNKELALKQRNYTIATILFAFVGVGGFSFSYYRRQQLKQENRLQAEIFKQQEVATKAVFDGEQQERIRIARDLHDSIGQMLSVVKMNLSSSKDNDDPTLQLVDKTIAEVRNISHNLIPEELNFGLFNALEDICDKINSAGSTNVILEVADEVKNLKFAKQNELSIYRIVQEVLGNMIKHAQASEIKLDIDRAINNIIISIKDNGKGFDTSKISESKGLGWKNISARVHLLDGKMQVQSERLSGTKIEISIPE